MIVSAAIIRDGVVFVDKGHAFIIHDMVKIHGFPKPITKVDNKQGFIDDAGKFLDRAEAGAHAIACGQIKEMKFFGGKELDSSELDYEAIDKFLKSKNIERSSYNNIQQCQVCSKLYNGPEPKLCCSGKDCGCMGMPIEPMVCSNHCYKQLASHP